jgi:PKD repeat protein
MSQGWVYISGTVTDIPNGLPVAGHPVTILMDSLNGVVYYSVVMTDSAGYYFEIVPILSDSTGVIYVQTLDCNNNLHQHLIIFDPVNNTFVRDFQICTFPEICQAFFSFYPVPQGSPDSFQFTDYSTGSITAWHWSFGDGNFSEEQNPFHAFPGPGTFEVCLTVTGNNCTDTYCQTLVISDTVYFQVYGQVFADNFPISQGTVQLFAQHPNGAYAAFGDEFPVDSNGVFYFTLVPDGNYLIQAVPYESSGYLPTYYGDVIRWQQAFPVLTSVPGNPFNINLMPFAPVAPGPGTLTGQINYDNAGRSVVDKIQMILMDENGTVINFTSVNSIGAFDFQALDYGTYLLRAELAGIASDNLKFEITAEMLYVDIVLSFNGFSVLDVDESGEFKAGLSVYPNPVHDRFNISIHLSGPAIIDFEIYSMTARMIYKSQAYGLKGSNSILIHFDDYPAGLYMLRISSGEGIIGIKKIVKAE